ncbi:MAG TPA: ANTAR domain-containing protein [Mycobacterium sp.]|jgi:hypothetical protein|nr:ANTAR domain-containing protein [Mycobacterium sp.]
MTQLGWRGDSASRRVIDVALGILMGLRGCSEQEAFDDLVGAVHATGVGPGTLARALVAVVGGASGHVPHQAEAMQRWGHVMADRIITANTPAD